jgi:uncharacterized repeat protein (TIGR02543 family)
MPTSSPSSYGNPNSGGCPFPGSSNKTLFTDETTPAMKSWANANTGKPITNITHTNRLISFDFMGDMTTYTITATCEPNGTITPTGETELYEGGQQKYTITPNALYDRDEVLINGTNNPAAVTSGTYTFRNVTQDQAIHATFAPKTYTVTFNANTGTGTMAKQDFTYGTTQKLTANSYTKTDYEFKNWNTQAGGTGTDYTDQQLIALTTNITLYAQWEGNVGIDEAVKANDLSLRIVPNPASDYVQLIIDNEQLIINDIEIFDVYGRNVSFNHLITSSSHHLINISHLPAGLYFVKAGNKTAKLLVQ